MTDLDARADGRDFKLNEPDREHVEGEKTHLAYNDKDFGSFSACSDRAGGASCPRP
jgi:hypothetical protein